MLNAQGLQSLGVFLCARGFSEYIFAEHELPLRRREPLSTIPPASNRPGRDSLLPTTYLRMIFVSMGDTTWGSARAQWPREVVYRFSARDTRAEHASHSSQDRDA